MRVSDFHPRIRHGLNGCVTIGSVVVCALILLTRLPGMELLGVGPNWLLIWVVAWSLQRTPFQGAIAGLCLGLMQDGLTVHHPTHTLSLAIAGFLTARLQKQKYIQEDFISVAMIVFGMAVVVETIMALQFSLSVLLDQLPSSYLILTETWIYHQQVALSSAILSSLWAPVVYYPLSRWWKAIRALS
ncbi:MAG: rod shape-determining protein MreD [Merismopedia sp. SIO2A8]|nr:rod shape-determining protein MreD [Symploca sp. SIO2B6]NET48431.1 rod shape-determining protein MreD [Merismopedia sp. SIO2A8]